jgi:hypothetical protein
LFTTASLALIAAITASAATTFSVSDVLLVPNGTAARPGIAFMSDSGSGFFYPGPGNGLRWIASGVAVLRLETSALMLDNGDLRGRNGSVTAPSIAFINDATSGLYTLGGSAGNWGITSAKTSSIVFSTSNVEIALPLSASKGITGSLLGSATTASAATSLTFTPTNQHTIDNFLRTPWFGRSGSADSQWNAVTWAPDVGLFAAVATDGPNRNRIMFSPDGINWTPRTGSATSTGYTSIVFAPPMGQGSANGFWAVVCKSGSNRIMYSTDLSYTVWNETNANGVTTDWTSVCIGSGSNIIGVGKSGAASTRAFVGGMLNGVRSTLTWTISTSAQSGDWESVCWSGSFSGPGKFVAVASAATGSSTVMWSTDGLAWTLATAITGSWYSIAFGPNTNPPFGRFVAVGPSGSVMYSQTSDPAGAWTGVITGISGSFTSVQWIPTLKQFVAVAASGSTGQRVMTSPDGISWVGRPTLIDNQWNSLAYSPSLNMAVAVASSGTGNRVMSSVMAPGFIIDLSGSVQFSNGTGSFSGSFFGDGSSLGSVNAATASAAASLMRSALTYKMPNAQQRNFLTSRTGSLVSYPINSNTASYEAIAWAPEISTFVALGTVPSGGAAVGDQRIVTSSDGLTWSAVSMSGAQAANANTQDICWAPSLKLFAVTTRSNGQVWTSPDGATWTQRSCSAKNWTSICWSQEFKTFLAVSSDGFYMYSSDGINWTTSSAGAINPFSKNIIRVCYSPSRKIFVVISDSGATGGSQENAFYTNGLAPNAGMSFNYSVFTGNGQYAAICFSPELDMFVAIGQGSGMRSTDGGVTWTTFNPPATGNPNWQGITWAPEIGLFIAVANSGTDRIATSPDGINWTARPYPLALLYKGLVWVPEMGIFIATDGGVNSGKFLRSAPAGGYHLDSNSSTLSSGSFVFDGPIVATGSLAGNADTATTASLANTSSYVNREIPNGGFTHPNAYTASYNSNAQTLMRIGAIGVGNQEFNPGQTVAYFVPFLLSQNATVDQLTIWVSTAATSLTSKAKVALYDSDPITFLPNNFLSGSGDLSIGVIGEKSGSITAVALKKHTMYWVGFVCSGTLGTFGIAGIPPANCLAGTFFGTTTGASFDTAGGKSYLFTSITNGSYTLPTPAGITGGNATVAPAIFARFVSGTVSN